MPASPWRETSIMEKEPAGRLSRKQRARNYLLGTPWATKKLYLRHEIAGSLNGRKPHRLLLGVTEKCQCSCVHCGLGLHAAADEPELTETEVQEILKAARELGVLDVTFFGGEPLLRNDLAAMVKSAQRYGFITKVFTNGLGLEESRVVELKKAGLHQCNVSLDSSIAEKHDMLRGVRGCFEKAIQGIRRLTAAGIKVTLWTYAAKEDVAKGLPDLKELIRFAKRVDLNAVMVLFPIPSGKWLERDDLALTLEEREKVRALAADPMVHLEFPTENHSCVAGHHFFYISPYGEVSLCPTMPFSLGSVRTESITSIYTRIKGSRESLPDIRGQCTMQGQDFRKRFCRTPMESERYAGA